MSRDEYDSIFKRLLPPLQPAGANQIVDEFNAFCESLCRTGFVDASIVRHTDVPTLFSLRLNPSGRPAEAQMFITFRVNTDGSITLISPDSGRILVDAQNASNYLSSFAQNPNFANTMAVFRARQSEAIFGTLRTGEWNELRAVDVAVQLSRVEHDKLAFAEEGQPVSLTGTEFLHESLSRHSEDKLYRFFDAEGFYLQSPRVELLTGEARAHQIRITGSAFFPRDYSVW